MRLVGVCGGKRGDVCGFTAFPAGGLTMVEIRTIPDRAPYSAAPALYRVPSVTSDFSLTIPGMRTI